MTELSKRVLTAAVGVPLVLAAIYLGDWATVALAAVLSTVAAIEFAGPARAQWGAFWPLPAILSGLAIVGGAGLRGVDGWRDGVLGSLLGLGAWAVLRSSRHQPRAAVAAWSATVAYVLAVPVLYAFIPLLRTYGRPALLWPVLIIWAADSLAYFAGRAWGRHPLAPGVSPGKSWEGFAAGLLAASLAGAGFAHLAGLPLVTTAWQSALLALAGVMGDLFESAFKRAAGTKDSGTILPGHGGVWDRFDSLAFALPVAFWFAGTWTP